MKSNKVMLITGATSGIGKALADHYYKKNYKLILVGGTKEKVDKLKRKFKNNVLAICADLTKPTDIKKIVRESINRFKKIDILIANAGLYEPDKILSGNPDRWDRVISVNVTSVFRLVNLVLPHMKKNKFGDIAITSSISGHQAIHWEPIYSASKHAIQSFAHGLRTQVAKNNIRVISIASWDFNEEGAKLVKRFKKLKSLKIHSSHSLTDKAVEEMIKAPNLELLEIRYAHPLPPNAVAIISTKKSLRNVDLGHSEPITKEQFVQLKKLPNLSYLRVSNSTSFTDSYVDMVKDMKLNFLDINGSAITDKGLLDLAECKNLKALRVSLVPEQLTEAGVKAFKIKNPNIKISVVGAFGSSSGVSSGNANLDGLLEDVARKVKKQRNR